MNWRRYIFPIFLIISWEFLSFFGLLDPLLVPSPSSIIKVGFSLQSLQKIGLDCLYSIYRLTVGFSAGSCVGLLLGLAMGLSRRVYESLEFLVDFFRSIPVAALFPLFLILVGIGDMAKISIIAWSTSLVVLINTMYGVQSCSHTRQRFAKTLKISHFQLLKTIIIPEAMPSIFAGLRIGVSIALIVVIITEMFFGTQTGLGRRIFDASLLYKRAEMYFCIMLTGLIGYSANQGFIRIERYVLRWNSK